VTREQENRTPTQTAAVREISMVRASQYAVSAASGKHTKKYSALTVPGDEDTSPNTLTMA
jgi:hypothetical protein